MSISITVTSDDAKYPAVLAIIGGAAAPAAGQTILASTAGATLTDPSGAVWSFGAGNIILKNGAQFGGGVGAELGLFNGSIYTIGTDSAVYVAGASGWAVSPTNPFAASTVTTPPPVVGPKESANGKTVLMPSSGFSLPIYDEALNAYQMFYDPGAEFWVAYINGGQTNWQANHMAYIYGTGPAGENECWIQNDAHAAGSNVGVWRNGGWQVQPAMPTIPSGGPVLGPEPGGGGSSGGTSSGGVSGAPVGTSVTATATGLSNALHAAAAGATVNLTAGVYTETSPIPVQLTLVGAGIGQTTINITGILPNQEKAALVPESPGTVIQGVSITGAAITNADGGNAAGVRDSGPGIGFALKNVEVFGCQDGLLTFPSPISLDTCHIHDNGNPGNGAGTHNIYCGGGALSIVNSVVEHCSHEHEVKSRATDTTITGSTLRTAGNGSPLDLPDGGNLTMSNTTLVVGAASNPSNQDTVAIHAWEESGNNPGMTWNIGPGVVIDATALPGVSPILAFGASVPAAFVLNCSLFSYKGAVPTVQGLAAGQITGAFVQAA